MRPIKKSFFIISLFISLFGCQTKESKYLDQYCGFELTPTEYESLIQESQIQSPSVYDKDSLWSIYDQVNDTLRNSMPDSIIFEVFLNTLNDKEFSFIVISPKNQDFLETLSCKFMNANFNGQIPHNRILLMHSYTKSDGSGDTPLEFVIKKREN